ncbi:MAG: flagellar hook-basal body protein [Tumebacillaceae bacterium]
MRSLWTSASGLNAQQMRMDAIANNLANINTTGYKSQDVQFKDMLYANYLQTPEVGKIQDTTNPRQSTLGLRIGQGVWSVGLSQTFSQGALQQTGNNTDLAIEGNGFFRIKIPNAPAGTPNVAYTRDGSFKFSNTGSAGDEHWILADSAGRAVMDTNDQEIDLTAYDLSSVVIGTDGTVSAKPKGGGALQAIGQQIDLVNIANPETNLKPAGNNLYVLNGNITPANRANIEQRGAYQEGKIHQREIEQSNVDMSGMMTEMIQAQRVYSMNAKALETTDQMMGMANNLRG